MNKSNIQAAERVAFYIYSLDQGGAERVTSILANKLSEFGIEVVVFVIKPVNSKSYALADNVQVVNLCEKSVPESIGNGLISNLKRISTLRREVKRYSPQVLYTMMTRANVIGTLALLGSAVPCVISERTDPSQYSVGRLWMFLRKIAYGFSYSVVAQTPRAQHWLKNNTSATRVEVIPNPIEIPIVDGQPYVEVPKKRGPMILAVGRLCSTKQFNHLIDAFSEITDEFPVWWVAILGEGQDRSDLKSKIVECGLEDRVKLYGRVGNIGDWYKYANLFVMTSRYEGYPNALIEAMANGLPAVSYDCPSGPAEVIQHGANGRLAEANNVQDLVSNMRAIMADATSAEKMAIKAKEIRMLLNPEDIAIQWLSVADLKRPLKESR